MSSELSETQGLHGSGEEFSIRNQVEIDELAKSVDDPRTGFYGPGSATWLVNRERVLLLSGVSAILLQLAHPMVARGVEEHSDFSRDPLGRFERTFEIVNSIAFGDVDSALGAAREVQRIHERVRGELKEDAGALNKGDSYHANRPDLLLWVHATLVDQALSAYQIFVAPLTDKEKEAYYEESKRSAVLMGIPRVYIPDDLEGFYGYYDIAAQNVLVETQTYQRQKKLLYRSSSIPNNTLDFLAGGCLSPDARESLGIEWNSEMNMRFQGFSESVRQTLPILPSFLRYNAEYRRNADRLSADYRRVLPGIRRSISNIARDMGEPGLDGFLSMIK